MDIVGYFFAIIIGLIMGIIGGGGSILSVPVFVYLFHIDAFTATTLSLFVVSITSLVGSLGYIKQGHVNFKTALLFGLPSVAGILFSRRIVLPHLPPFIINKWGISITKETFILILFAILMLISAFKMIKRIDRQKLPKSKETNYTLLISQGILVGIVTGFIGAGGGFLIVPALVMLLGISMKQAVATSLFIITINAMTGFISSLDKTSIDWSFLLFFSGLSILGIIIGVQFSKKISSQKLKPMFGWVVLIMGIWIIINELLIKHIP